MLKKVSLIGLAVASLVAAAQPVMAVSWGPVTSTYNGIVRVEGYGNFYNNAGTHARSNITVKDRSNDGNNVYGKTTFQFWRMNSGGTMAWMTSGTKSTPEFANTTRTYNLDWALHSQSSSARGQHQACAQMGWPVPDSCSSTAFTTFNY